MPALRLDEETEDPMVDSDGEPLPNLAPEDGSWDGEMYLDAGLPQKPFLLQDVENLANIDGPFDGRDFVRDEETGTLYASTDGRPMFLRVIRQVDDEIWTVDGGGNVFHYQLVT